MAKDALFELRRRTFDTPRFKGIEFIESEAKSILNHVPGNRLPFNWTINPYRGCSHACGYCMSGDTPILMADGRTKPIKELVVGDRIYGTSVEGSYRRYVETEVLAHWETAKHAYKVILEDGTEFVCSGDHRFLSNRGWKFVIGAQQGQDRRPHLTTRNKLMGLGKLAVPPEHNPDFRTGYLCGIVRGDANLGHYEYESEGSAHGNVHRFRLALADSQAIDRAKLFLSLAGVETRDFTFYEGSANHREITAIRTQSEAAVRRIESLIEWPSDPSTSWTKGFLAGIFDAEGCFSHGVLRISNCDQEIIAHIVESSEVLDSGTSWRRAPALTSRSRTSGCLASFRRKSGSSSLRTPLLRGRGSFLERRSKVPLPWGSLRS